MWKPSRWSKQRFGKKKAPRRRVALAALLPFVASILCFAASLAHQHRRVASVVPPPPVRNSPEDGPAPAAEARARERGSDATDAARPKSDAAEEAGAEADAEAEAALPAHEEAREQEGDGASDGGVEGERGLDEYCPLCVWGLSRTDKCFAGIPCHKRLAYLVKAYGVDEVEAKRSVMRGHDGTVQCAQAKAPTTEERAHRLEEQRATPKVKVLSQNGQCSRSVRDFPAPPVGDVTMTDHSRKIMLVGVPKGGATITAQVFLKHVGVLDEALAYDPWIHNYRRKVFLKKKRHKEVACKTVCCQPGWVCAKVVRSPLDRVVSSYLHTMSQDLRKHFPQLATAVNASASPGPAQASFADFVAALVLLRDAPPSVPNPGWSHYLPQSTTNPSCNDHPNVYLLPVEEAEQALAAFARETGVAYNATGFTSGHYVSNTPRNPGAGTTFDVRESYAASMRAVPYRLYLSDPRVNADICAVYCRDLFLYAKACASAWLRSSRRVQTACRAERERVVTVCGKNYDFF